MSAAEALAAGRQIRRYFAAELQACGYHADAAQQAASAHLADWLAAQLAPRGRAWRRRPASGVYLHGGIGRGKSFVMDCFFAAAPVTAKRRVHFHAFLQELQAGMRAYAGLRDPLLRVAEQLAADTRLLCFDEFHVHDIADAVMLGRVLEVLLARGTLLVATSNYRPAELCPEPRYQARFKPTIGLLEQHFDILALEGGQDYRALAPNTQRQAFARGLYCWPQSPLSEPVLRQALGVPAEQVLFTASLAIGQRQLHGVTLSASGVWLRFADLFEAACSAQDYLWLSEHFDTLAVSEIPCLEQQSLEVLQRFLNFVDIAYDRGTCLLFSAAVALEQLAAGRRGGDFARALSRLRQLQARPLAAPLPLSGSLPDVKVADEPEF